MVGFFYLRTVLDYWLAVVGIAAEYALAQDTLPAIRGRTCALRDPARCGANNLADMPIVDPLNGQRGQTREP